MTGRAEEPELRVLQIATSERAFLSQQVRALAERGVSSTVLTVPRRENGSRGPAEYARFAARVAREATLGDYDLVHANYGLVGPIALAQPVRPVVLTLWGSELMGENRWLEGISRASARRSDAVVAPTRVLARELEVPHRVIPFGVDADRFRPLDRRAARERVGWDPAGTHVLFPYDPDRAVKDHPLAERVVARVPGEVTLRAVSGVPHEEMPYYVNASDALLVTSRRESGPMVVKEAAACNVPVVSTDVGFAREVLADVENSHVAEGEAELAAALADVLARGERSNGREIVDGLSVETMGDRLASLYRDLTAV